MSGFSVIATALGGHAARLSDVTPQLDEARGRMAAGASAGAHTPAGGALEHLTGHLHASLAEFGASADALHRALVAAGDEYGRVDAVVAESAV